MLLSIGDGGNLPSQIDGKLTRDLLQDLSMPFGEVMRLSADGSIPADNPHVKIRLMRLFLAMDIVTFRA